MHFTILIQQQGGIVIDKSMWFIYVQQFIYSYFKFQQQCQQEFSWFVNKPVTSSQEISQEQNTSSRTGFYQGEFRRITSTNNTDQEINTQMMQ